MWQLFIVTFFRLMRNPIWSSLIHFGQIWSKKIKNKTAIFILSVNVTRRNFYNAFPERSGGAVILCNKCRVTKNFFWTDFFWIWYLFLEYFYFNKMIYFLKDNLDLRIHQFSKNEPKNLKDFCPMSYKNSQAQFLKIFRFIFWKLMIS